jgi:folate-dependent phosphoribosylglycinamide formyltransferase PurN
VNWVEKINECYTIEEITAIHPSVPPEFEGVWQERFLSISNGTAGTPKGGTK